ncbi:MAG: SxtJ family membrane protein [Chitinophagales bacterium]|nr:SxtJ family membrane protein [Chitinophagales bacterium]
MRKHSYDREQQLETILSIAAGALAFYFITGQKVLVIIAFSIALIGIFSQLLSFWITVAWLKLGDAMGFVSSKVVLGFLFYILLFPLSLMMRLTGNKDPLRLKKASGSTSTYTVRNHTYTPKDLEKMW